MRSKIDNLVKLKVIRGKVDFYKPRRSNRYFFKCFNTMEEVSDKFQTMLTKCIWAKPKGVQEKFSLVQTKDNLNNVAIT